MALTNHGHSPAHEQWSCLANRPEDGRGRLETWVVNKRWSPMLVTAMAVVISARPRRAFRTPIHGRPPHQYFQHERSFYQGRGVRGGAKAPPRHRSLRSHACEKILNKPD